MTFITEIKSVNGKLAGTPMQYWLWDERWYSSSIQ